MKHILIVLLVLATTAAFGQKLPKISQLATVNQTIGLNEISITYSRPSANNRVIFGELVSYDKVWRLGANECSKFSCSQDITIGENTLPAGTYGMFAIPTKNKWTIIFNSVSDQWGSYDFDPNKNVLTYDVAVVDADKTECLSICFENLTSSSANMVIRWGDVMVALPFSTNTSDAVQKEIQSALETEEDQAKVHYNAADYYVDIDNLDAANAHLESSLEIERAYYNVFMKAQMISEEDPKAARKLADEAIKLAQKADKKGWENHIKRLSKDWK